MTRLSIVIPVLGNVAELERTLVSVLANRPDDCEVLAILNTDYDDPYNLAEEVRFLAARPRSRYIECANVGIARSEAPIVHILSAGMEVQEGWADAALESFDNPQVAAVAPLILSSDDSHRPLSAGVMYRSGGTRVTRSLRTAEKLLGPDQQHTLFGPSSSAAFYRVGALDAVGGGLPNTLGNDLADIQLAMELHATGYESVFDPRVEILADELPSWDGHGFRHGLHAERMFWLHAAERGKLKSLFLHPFTVLADAVSSLPSPAVFTQLLGRLAGCLPSGFSQQTTHRVAQRPAVESAPAKLPEGMRIDASHESRQSGQKKTPAPAERRAA